jgi:hypothetical protein
MTLEFTGWRQEDEERDFEKFKINCESGLCCGKILNWSDVESQISLESKNPVITPIQRVAQTLYSEGNSVYSKYIFGRQETNDCGSWGTSNGIDLTQLFQAWRGIETKIYRTFKPWIYGVAKCMNGSHRDNGMSISLAMNWVTQYGILPDDLSNLPKYSGQLQQTLLRSGERFFEQWKSQAILYDIEVVQLPLDFDVWYSWAASGRYIVYGTTQRLGKRGDEWELDGSTNHCRCCGAPVEPKAKKITDVNSWDDGDGFMSAEIAKKVIAKASRYGCFGIYRIARRNEQTNYSGLGRN